MSIRHPVATPPERELYDEIVRRIVAVADPDKIILFGSRARGDHRPDSDVDLFVELDSTLRPAERRRLIRSAFRPRTWAMDVFVYTPQEVARFRGVNGTLMSIIDEEGRILYERPASNYRDWIRSADDDLLTVDSVMAAFRVPWGIVCYHSQQAGEKLLKALLVYHGSTPQRTHDLGALLTSCREVDPEVGVSADDCDLLSDYAVTARYPEDIPPSEDEARAAVAAARRIQAGILSRLPLPPTGSGVP
jgi:HEPN domain-containing protein